MAHTISAMKHDENKLRKLYSKKCFEKNKGLHHSIVNWPVKSKMAKLGSRKRRDRLGMTDEKHAYLRGYINLHLRQVDEVDGHSDRALCRG